MNWALLAEGIEFGLPSSTVPRENEESLRAIRETQEMIAQDSGKSYSTGRDLIDAALT